VGGGLVGCIRVLVAGGTPGFVSRLTSQANGGEARVVGWAAIPEHALESTFGADVAIVAVDLPRAADVVERLSASSAAPPIFLLLPAGTVEESGDPPFAGDEILQSPVAGYIRDTPDVASVLDVLVHLTGGSSIAAPESGPQLDGPSRAGHYSGIPASSPELA
jgi:hypothetical protein